MRETMTLAEITKTTPMTELAEGTQIPTAALDEIYAWYQYRHVCDNERFSAYFNRQLRMLERQYLLLLRNDMTTWDPMVTDYMERQILSDKSGNSNLTTKGTTNSTRKGDVTHTTAGEDVTDTSGSNDNTRTMDTEQTTDGSNTQGGKDTVKADGTRTDNLTHERNTTTTREDNTTQETNSNSMANEIGDTVNLQGATPDSATYGAGGSFGIAAPDADWPAVMHETGAPDKLNWTYTGGQQEQISKGDRVSREAGSTHNSGTVTETQGGDTKDTGTVVNDDTQVTTYGRTDTDHHTTSNYGTVTDAGKTAGKTTVKYGRTLTDTNNITDEGSTDQTQTGTSGEKLDHKERYSGRHEAPTELLRKAQSYILGSNSLKWLIAQLEPVFFQIFESW